MTENEAKLLNRFISLDKNINDVRTYIKENFNIDSSYNEETNTINIWTSNILESLQLVAAKDYIHKTIGEDMINVVYNK